MLVPRDPRAHRPEADLLRRAAARLRTQPECARRVGLTDLADAPALAALLDLMAAELPHVDTVLRLVAVEASGRLLA